MPSKNEQWRVIQQNTGWTTPVASGCPKLVKSIVLVDFPPVKGQKYRSRIMARGFQIDGICISSKKGWPKNQKPPRPVRVTIEVLDS